MSFFKGNVEPDASINGHSQLVVVLTQSPLDGRDFGLQCFDVLCSVFWTDLGLSKQLVSSSMAMISYLVFSADLTCQPGSNHPILAEKNRAEFCRVEASSSFKLRK